MTGFEANLPKARPTKLFIVFAHKTSAPPTLFPFPVSNRIGQPKISLPIPFRFHAARMPAASRKVTAKTAPAPAPAAAASPSRPKAKVPPCLGGCDEDDDFENPPSWSRARPLKPCNINGSAASRRPCKKLKPSYSSSAKENRSATGSSGIPEKVAVAVPRAAETLAAGSRVNRCVPGGKTTIGGEICGISRYGSDGSKFSRNVKEAPARYGNCESNSNPFPILSESRVTVLGELCDLGGGCSEEAEMVGSTDCASSPDEGQTTVNKKCFDAPEGVHQSRLIESDGNCEFMLADSCDSEGLGPAIRASSLTDNPNIEEEAGLESECGFESHNENHHLYSLEPNLLTPDYGGGNYKEAQNPGSKARSLVSQERKVAAEHSVTPENETMETKLCGPEACKETYCSNSSESELLQSQIPCDFKGDGYGNFEIGTQLSELINLCMEDSTEGHLNCRTSPIEKNACDSKHLDPENHVLCPLCGSDISDLSEERRQLHTNNCLDEPAKVQLQYILNHFVFDFLSLARQL